MTLDHSNLPEDLRRITELAPMVPAEYLRRVGPHLPIVQEAADVIQTWYTLLAHALRAQVEPRLSPGVLDRDLERMYTWLRAIGRQPNRLHAKAEGP